MKELTIEEKAKRYDEAIENAKTLYENANGMILKKWVERVFPELKKDEGEEIRKWIIDDIRYNMNNEPLNNSEYKKKAEKAITWLEKQSIDISSFPEEQQVFMQKYTGLDKITLIKLLAERDANNAEIIESFEKQSSEPNWCHHKVDLSDCSEEYRKAYYDGWNNCNMQHSQCKLEKSDVLKCLINGFKFYYEDNKEATWGTQKFSMKVKNILSWLEKQGNQKSIDDLTQQEAMDIAVAKCFEQGKQKLADNVEPKFKFGDIVRNKKSGLEQRLGGCIEDVYEGAFPFRIKDQDDWELVEQKPTNKVKPKFKEGEWIISDTVDKDYHICKIIGIKDGNYTIESIYGYKGYNQFDVFDTSYKLWTIQDAQDGDVLVTDSGRPFIFKGCLDKDHPNSPVAYCGINSMNEFFVSEGINWWTDKNVYPATKEQRELLFKKMKASGYEWDADKKELKKIEQKSSNNQFTPEQANVLDKHIDKLVEQKSAWSEEDDKILKSIIINIENLQFSEDMREKYHHIPNANKNYYQIKIDWLKSLKDRYIWKPSDEQMKFLWKYAEQNNCDGSILTSLYNDLKKLKG